MTRPSLPPSAARLRAMRRQIERAKSAPPEVPWRLCALADAPTVPAVDALLKAVGKMGINFGE